MQEERLFEYAILRVVPRVEREEFVNVGVVLYCRQLKLLKAEILLNEKKLRMLDEHADIEQIGKYLDAFAAICAGDTSGGPIAALDIASRFRWLTATRSTILQTSKVHPGLCKEPEVALARLFAQQVAD